VERGGRKLVVIDPQLLQADDIGRRFGEPCDEMLQPAANAVDVERRDLHRSILRPTEVWHDLT